MHHVARQLEEIKSSINLIASGFYKPHILVQNINEHRAEIDQLIQEAELAKPLDASHASKSKRKQRRHSAESRKVVQEDGKTVAITSEKPESSKQL